jgi:hypothetical protein
VLKTFVGGTPQSLFAINQPLEALEVTIDAFTTANPLAVKDVTVTTLAGGITGTVCNLPYNPTGISAPTAPATPHSVTRTFHFDCAGAYVQAVYLTVASSATSTVAFAYRFKFACGGPPAILLSGDDPLNIEVAAVMVTPLAPSFRAEENTVDMSPVTRINEFPAGGV